MEILLANTNGRATRRPIERPATPSCGTCYVERVVLAQRQDVLGGMRDVVLTGPMPMICTTTRWSFASS
jgi:hypothetical protein